MNAAEKVFEERTGKTLDCHKEATPFAFACMMSSSMIQVLIFLRSIKDTLHLNLGCVIIILGNQIVNLIGYNCEIMSVFYRIGLDYCSIFCYTNVCDDAFICRHRLYSNDAYSKQLWYVIFLDDYFN